MRRLFFFWQYLLGQPPWESGLAAPELVRVVAERPAGVALDLGCGTGTQARYLAEHGWRVTGIDFIPQAIAKARVKTRGLAVTLLVGDVTRLETLALAGPFDLALDMGCWHSLDEAGRRRYAAGLARWMTPNGLFMLYAFQPGAESDQWGLPKSEVVASFSPGFTLTNYEQGQGRPSAWYYLNRIAD